MKTIHENDLTDAEWSDMMDQASTQGFWMFLFGLCTFFIGPILYLHWQERKHENS